MTTKEELLQKIEELKNQVNKLELKENTEINFSEFIWRDWTKLAIKWKEKYLFSFWSWSIKKKKKAQEFEDKVTYTKTTLDKLEVGDVFIFEEVINDIEIDDFYIIVWIDNDWHFRAQYISNAWCDYIDYNYFYKDNSVVYKINRF